MAIQRASDNYNSDWMSRMQDDELEELEKRLSALYASATKEVTDKFNEFTEEFAEQEARMLDLLALGKIDDDDFRIWRNNHILQSVRYQELIKSLANMMVDTDVSAMAIVSGDLPAVIAQSYNFMQALGWDAANQAGYSAGTFTIYNASAVQALIRDNPDLLPSVKKPIDEAWNMSKITREITQGIIQGNTMPQIADRLRRVVGMDENTAMRNARTAFTYAENMGRNESINNLQSRGIPMEKVWSAVMDNRTRQTHRLLNGTTPDKATGLYGVGILAHPLRFPADKSGDAEEIYNCRCRLSGQFDSSIVDHSNDDELYEQFLRENYPNDYEALMDRDYFNQHTSKPLPRPEVAVPAVASDLPSIDELEDVTQTAEDILGNAYENHRIDNDLRSTPLEDMKDSPLSSVSASYEHLSDETAEKINEALTKLTNDYDTPLCRIRTMDSSEALGNKAFATTIHNYSVDTAEIILNPMKMGDYDQMTERVMELVSKGYAAQIPPENAGEYIITHEFGHSILNMRDTLPNSQNWVDADYDKIRSARMEINEIYQEYTSVVGQLESEKKLLEFEVIMGTAGDDTAEKARELGRELAETKISNYSLTNVDEFLAESFANERLGINSNPYSERAVNVLDKYFRR